MAALRRLIVPLALLLATPAYADAVDRWQPYVAEASARFGIPEEWIAQVMRAESGGQTHRNRSPIRSRVGAIGLMQIMPATWGYLRRRYGLGSNPDDPRANILGGTAYLREMYDRFGHPGLFAAYNAGPARYADYLAGRSRLPAETVTYISNVTGRPRLTPPVDAMAANQAMPVTVSPSPVRLFAVRHQPDSSVAPVVAQAPAPLFVALSSAQRGAE